MKTLRYKAANGFGATCGVEIIDLAAGIVGLALCEPPNYGGPSITNNIEIAATLAVRRLGLDPDRTVCFEHYPTGNCGREKSTWDYVRFTVKRDRDGLIVLDDPDWRPLRLPEQWRAFAESVAQPDVSWAKRGFGDLTYPEELLGRIDGLWPADVPAGWGECDLDGVSASRSVEG